jgi:hypothetical protein
MRSWALFALATALACSSSGKGPPPEDAGSDATDATGGTKTCQTIRNCALDCPDDACVATCKQGASSTEQANFDALDSCTKTMGGCTTPNDINCLCLAQCIEEPPCVAQLGTCLGNVTMDLLCDVRGCA